MTQEQKELLEKAKREYPAGTEFISVMQEVLSKSYGRFSLSEHSSAIFADGMAVYFNNKWAEIISKPISKLSDGLGMGYNPEPVKVTPPIDMENDPRYKKFLNEEVKNKTPYDTYQMFELETLEFKKSMNIEDLNEDLRFRISAQRLYFEELIKEKDENTELACSKWRELIGKNQHLSAQLAEREEYFSKVEKENRECEKIIANYYQTIEQQKKEIEQFINARRKQDEYYASEEVRHYKELTEARAEIERLKEELKWNYTSQCLPDTHRRVLIEFNNQIGTSYEAGFYSNDQYPFHQGGNSYKKEDVNRWSYMQQPPIQSQELNKK